MFILNIQGVFKLGSTVMTFIDLRDEILMAPDSSPKIRRHSIPTNYNHPVLSSSSFVVFFQTQNWWY